MPQESVRFKAKSELGHAAEAIESPYDVEARYRSKGQTKWTGYMVHLSETCEPEQIHLITHVETTTASVHEAKCTAAIQQALVDKRLPPDEHLVDAAYIDAELLVSSQQDHGITLFGPARKNASWQARTEGAYTIDQFEVDWDRKQVHCPQGRVSAVWSEQIDHTGGAYLSVRFSQRDCADCARRSLCTRALRQGRWLKLQPQAQYEALCAIRAELATEEGKKRYAKRAGVEGTISQGVRAFGLRRTRYRGLAKTHLQQVATAAAINVDRIFAWLEGVPHAATRTSRFAALAA